MKISIIVPIYNTAKYLGKCIESLINQTYKNLEIILIDDGSTDDSLCICKQYAKKDNRIKVFSQKNGGPSSARNNGLKNATGEWIMFVDSDDYIKSVMCEKLYNKILENDSDMVICNLQTILPQGKIKQSSAFYSDQKVFNETGIYELEKMIVSRRTETGYGIEPFLGPVCKLIRKQAINKCTFLEEMDYGEDTCFVLSVLRNTKRVTYINEVLYVCIARSSSLSRGFNENLSDRITVFVNWLIRYYKDDMEMSNSLKRLQMSCMISIVINYFNVNSKLAYSKKINKIRKYIVETGYNIVISDIFRENIANLEKIILMIIKFRMYWLINILFKIRYTIREGLKMYGKCKHNSSNI